MKTLIIEDEKIAANNLEKLLKQISPKIQILDKIETIRSSVNWLLNNEADLIFLDIHLADGLSFKIFNEIEINTPVIFTTAYDQYAIKAFKLNSVDYLLKPIDIDELRQAIYKFEKIHTSDNSTKLDYNVIVELIQNPGSSYQKRFLINVGSKIRSVDTENIAYFYAEDKAVYICTKDKHRYIIDQTIEKLETILDPEFFFKISRKFIIHVDAIEEMHTLSKSRIKIDLNPPCDSEAIVTINNVSEFKNWLKGNNQNYKS